MHLDKARPGLVPILAALAALALPAAAAAAAKAVPAAARIAPLFQPATHRSGSGASLPYRFYAPPPAAGTAARRPVVLFLHGEEAAGTDNLAQLTTTEGATIWVEPDHLAKNPAYVLAPQAPPGVDWGQEPVYGDTVGLLKRFVADHRDVDPDRIYVVGFSMGGTGAWTMLLRNPGLFAAAIPISGNANAFLSDAKAFAAIRNTPVLPVHSYDDPLSPVSGTQNAVDAMVAAGDASVGSNSQIWGLGAVVPAHDAWLPASLGHAATVGRATIVHDLNNVRATSGALRSLAVGTGSLSPAFRPYRFFYSVSVGPDVAAETITPVALARDARAVSVDGEPLEKGASCKAPLQPGRNTFAIVVTTAEGASRRYDLTVNRAR